MNFSSFLFFIRHEVRLMWRLHDSALSLLFFVSLILLLLSLGFGSPAYAHDKSATTLIWLSVLFGGVLRMNRTFEAENEGMVTEGLKMTPEWIFPFLFSKWFVNFLFLLLLELFSLAVSLLLFNIAHPLHYLQISWPVYLLGALGLATIGTFTSGMLSSYQRKDLILPVIAYPLLMPLIIGVMMSFEYSSAGELTAFKSDWVRLLAGFDVIFMVASWMASDYLLES